MQEAPDVPPGLRLSRWVRLAGWILVIVVALSFHTHFAISLACLLILFGLLCTTPANAIRLPRWISEIFVLFSTLMMDHGRAPLPLAVHMGILFLMLLLLRLWGKSPWWAVLFGWFPG